MPVRLIEIVSMSGVMVSGDLAAVARSALTAGAAGLAQYAIRILSPVKPMLAQTANGVGDAISSLGRAAFEHKLDGARVQVEVAFNDIQESPHYPGGLALRFARVKRYRPEKRPEDADTIGTVREIHARMSHTRSVTPE